MDSLRQPASFRTVVGQRRGSTTLSEAKTAPKEDYGYCLVVCRRSHPPQLPQPGRNDYGREVLSTYQRYAPEAAAYMPGIGQQKGANSAPRQCPATRCTTDPAEVERIGLRDSVSSAILVGPLAHRLPLFQASRQLPPGEMLQKPR